MNDNIRALAEQAGKGLPSEYVHSEFTEKFAALIVKECAEMVRHNIQIHWLTAAQVAKDMEEEFIDEC